MHLSAPIETQRLVLRTLTPADVTDRYVSWLEDPQVTRYLEVRFHRQSPDSVRAYVEQMNASPDTLLLGIFTRDGDTHIGNIKLGPIDRHHERAEVGIMIGDRGSWGRGYAGEAIKALTGHAFDHLGLHKVSCGLYADNEGSRRAFLKAGWFEEGRRREHWSCDGRRQDDVQMGCLRGEATPP
jgi:ribosomal-protein-alanine N-acetyltransferase